MNNIKTASTEELLGSFRFPDSYTRVVALGLVSLEPWHILQREAMEEAMRGLRQRYPQRALVPFARRQDNDDVACWQIGSGEEVIVVHDFASSGWEDRARFESFYDWFRAAIEDLIEFDT